MIAVFLLPTASETLKKKGLDAIREPSMLNSIPMKSICTDKSNETTSVDNLITENAENMYVYFL